MKKILFEIGQPISNVAQLSSVVSSNPNSESISKNLEKDLTKEQKTFIDISDELWVENKDLLSKLTNLIVDNGNSKPKSVNFLKNEEFQELLKQFLNKLFEKKLISKEIYDEKINNIKLISDEEFKKIVLQLSEFSFEESVLKKKILWEVPEELKFKNNNKFVLLDENKKYRLNFVTGDKNTKALSLTYQKVKEKIDQMVMLKELMNEWKAANVTKAIALKRALGLSASSILWNSLSISFDRIISTAGAFGAFLTSVLSMDSYKQMTEIEKDIENAEKRVEEYSKWFFNMGDPFKLLKELQSDISTHASLVNSSIGLVSSSFRFLNKELPKNFLGKFLKGWEKVTTTKTFVRFNLGNDFLAIWLNKDEEERTIEKIEYISQKEKEIDDLLEILNKQLDSLKQDKWVVINETRQTDYYFNRGRGGRNKVFRNLKSGEEKTLDEMLKYSKSQLKKWGLQKVHHPKKGWYIRTIPNKIKEDNLG
ncbi:Uncharacterised protein [Mycoplasmopsis citelli]|uniref:Uncharacterized protein n=1 Tax=Mycoplasmopsis citelli TaxID=171281 RepID=A0A449B2Z9_9BACT|nr:hypothetical protein [Mycoplasmopsis citelli]VEU74977.1 Uncharacterised protein [Mycoplasmopsis citelli]